MATSASTPYRGKGGKTGRRELPVPAVEALRAALRARDLDLEVMEAPPSLYGASRAVRSTRSSNGTSGTQGFPRPGSTSSGTPPQSSAVTRARVLRTCLGSWITPLWRSPLHTCGGWRARRTMGGDGWRRRSGLDSKEHWYSLLDRCARALTTTSVVGLVAH